MGVKQKATKSLLSVWLIENAALDLRNHVAKAVAHVEAKLCVSSKFGFICIVKSISYNI